MEQLNNHIIRDIRKLPLHVKKEIIEANKMPDKVMARVILTRIANENKLWGYAKEMSKLIHQERILK